MTEQLTKMLPNKRKENLVESFKKSIESTIKAISDKKKINIKFGNKEKKNLNNISLSSVEYNKKFVNKDIIRGEGDTASLIEKYHSQNIHKKFLPGNKMRESIFNELECLRCEIIGSEKMLGVKNNIDFLEKTIVREAVKAKEKLSEDITFKLVVKKKINNHKIDNNLKKNCDPILEKVLKVIENKNINFKSIINSQKDFSKLSLDLINLVYDKNEDSNNEKDDSNDKNNNEDDKNTGEDKNQENQDFEEIKEDLLQTPIEQESDEKIDLDKNNIKEEDDNNNAKEISNKLNPDIENSDAFTYKIYTNRYDSIAPAERLCNLDEINKLRVQLDKQTEKLDNTINILANKFQRKLLSRQKRWWEFDMEEGILDSGKLSRIIISPESSLSYKKEAEIDFKDTVVSLLIDNSGSMRGRPITIAAISTDIISKTLERCGVKVEVLGFTTNSWKGGRARDLWIKENKSANPGRLNELLHIIYKSADTPIRRSKKNFGIMLKEGLLKENIDGEALDWAFKRINIRSEKRKVLMVISDGAPVDDSTLSANTTSYLDLHLKEKIKFIEKKSNVELLAIGIGHDVTRYYNKAVTILDVDDLAEVMSKQLIELF